MTHCCGFGIEKKLSIQDVMNANRFLMCFLRLIVILGINLHGSIDPVAW